MDDGYDGGAYVDCTECGDPVEGHDREGCHAHDGRTDADPCNCPARWTVKEIMALRRSYGLPGEWRR